LTWLVLTLEFLIPLLILLPGKKGRLRITAFILIILLHAGIASTLYVGLFPLIGIVTALALIRFSPLHQRAAVTDDRPVLIATNTFVISIISVCMIINFSGLPAFSYELHSVIRAPAYTLRLDQYWGMFSPSVLRKDGWFVYQGVDSLNRTWDLRTGRQGTDFSKPAHIVSMYS